MRDEDVSSAKRGGQRALFSGMAWQGMGWLAMGWLVMRCTPGPATSGTAVGPAGALASAPTSASAAAPSASVSSRPPPVAVNPGRCPTELRVDDAEDGDAKILATDQRSGSWFTYKDKVGTIIEPPAEGPFTLAEGGAEGSKRAARIRGKTAPKSDPHAGLGLRFAESGVYDLSCCRGISFWAKKGQGSIDVFRLTVGDVNTVPEGGVCKECSNELGVDLGLTDEWKQYTVEFAWMRQQPYWGDRFDKVALDKVFHLHWQTTYRDHDYDLWVDDVRLVGCGAK